MFDSGTHGENRTDPQKLSSDLCMPTMAHAHPNSHNISCVHTCKNSNNKERCKRLKNGGLRNKHSKLRVPGFQQRCHNIHEKEDNLPTNVIHLQNNETRSTSLNLGKKNKSTMGQRPECTTWKFEKGHRSYNASWMWVF